LSAGACGEAGRGFEESDGMEMGREEYLCVALRPAFFREGCGWLTSGTKPGSCGRDLFVPTWGNVPLATAKLIRVSGAFSARVRFMRLARLCVLMCSILPGLKILRDLAGEILQLSFPGSN
jgi:hypothetical protein